MKLEEAIEVLKPREYIPYTWEAQEKAYDTLKQFIEGDSREDVKETIKRLRQETCPATYMPDFDKEKCLQVIEQALQRKSLAERCWEIVKAKRVDEQLIRISDDVEWYNKEYIDRHKYKYLNDSEVFTYLLTEAEFETLKEGLK